jgi:DNA-binding beta-propeller fold protein YncE
VLVSAEITGLTPNTTYHYRISATNSGGTSEGSDETFKTISAVTPLTVLTKAASAVTQTSATLNATINPNGGEVSECKFEYGTTRSYGQSVPCSSLPAAVEYPVAVSASLTGLTADGVYHYRISATNPGGTSKGADKRFTTDPPTVVTEAATSITRTSATLNATVNPGAEELSECTFEYGTSTAYGQSAACSSLPEAVEYPVAVSAALSGLSANTTYHFRISATNPSGPSEGADETFRTPPGCGAEGFCASFTPPSSIEGSFREPEALAVDPSGDIFVADSGHDRVLEFNSGHDYLRQFGSEGSGEGQFRGIRGIATSSSGDLYVSDYANDRIQEFSPTGAFLRQFGSGQGQLIEPTAIALDSEGDVWVLSSYGTPVQEYSPSGEYLFGLGSVGSGDGQFERPSGLAISAGNLYVAEWTNQRVQELSTSGGYIGQFDQHGTGQGRSSLPWGIASDPTSGELYVTEVGNDRVQEFSPEGGFIAAFGSEGSGAGELSSPKGLDVSSAGEIYVADTGNQRIEEWVLP